MKKLLILLSAATLLAACSDNDDKVKKTYITVDFEDVPSGILAVDAYGSNFYSEYEGTQYTEYTDGKSGLHFSINESSYYNAPDFSAGGTVFSTFNSDLTTNSYKNQCTVNYKDPGTGYGGYKGSKVFGVVFDGAVINFPKSEEHLIDHLWAMNTAYATLAMKNGNDFANSITDGGHFYTTITGYNASGTKTGSKDLYLGDFREANSPGIIDQWTKVDLTSLGKVNKIVFSFSGSDMGEHEGSTWLNTPAYVCIDDIAIVKETEK